MTLKRRRFRDKLLEGSARPSECEFVGNEPRNFYGERETFGRRRAPFRVRGWRVGTIEGRVDLRAVKQPGVALEMRSCGWTTVCGQSRNRPSRGPDVNASRHDGKWRERWREKCEQRAGPTTMACSFGDGRNGSLAGSSRIADLPTKRTAGYGSSFANTRLRLPTGVCRSGPPLKPPVVSSFQSLFVQRICRLKWLERSRRDRERQRMKRWSAPCS